MNNSNNIKKLSMDYQKVMSPVPPVKNNGSYINKLGEQIDRFSCDTKYYTKKGPSVRVIGYVR